MAGSKVSEKGGTPRVGEQFLELLAIMARLRGEDGCPWDRKQTAQSLKSYVLEEAQELLEAIDSGDTDHIREELGDLLFHVVFLNHLFEEQGIFGMEDVLSGISKKMIRRHPHVFGNARVESEQELRRQWQEIKALEKNERCGGRPSNEAGLPDPALHPVAKRN